MVAKGKFFERRNNRDVDISMINEAVKVLEENKAQRPSDIDVIWLFGYGLAKR